MSRLIAVFKSLIIGSAGSDYVAPPSSGNLFIPSGSDSLITSDSLTFNHSGA